MGSTELKEGNNYDKKSIIILVLILLLGVFGWFLLTNIPNDGSRADKVRDDIQAVRDKQQSAIDRIEGIESTIRDAQKSADNINDSINTSQGINADSAGLTREGQSILRGIRQRNEK